MLLYQALLCCYIFHVSQQTIQSGMAIVMLLYLSCFTTNNPVRLVNLLCCYIFHVSKKKKKIVNMTQQNVILFVNKRNNNNSNNNNSQQTVQSGLVVCYVVISFMFQNK